jgi:hypothetical protein
MLGPLENSVQAWALCSKGENEMTILAEARKAFEVWYDAQPDGKLNPYDVFLAGMAKAREIDSGICDAQGNVWAMYCAVEIRSQGKK